MKKVFAILLVLALVAGFAFAEVTGTDTHKLTVSSTVGEHLPAFQLRFTGRTINIDAYGNVTDKETGLTTVTNDGKVAFVTASDPNYVDTYTTERNTLDAGWDLGDGKVHRATFYVYIVKDEDDYTARTKRTYTLTFSDGVFEEVKSKGDDYNGDGKLSPVIAAAPADVASIDGITSSTAEGAVTTVKFSGSSCPETDTEVASATYEWQGDKLIDMGTYYADIVLTITQD